MKILLLIIFSSIAQVAHAIPISYVFGGHVTQVSDITDSPEVTDDDLDENLPQLKDWLEVGDKYHGRMIFDSDTIAYGANCNQGIICGGVTFFEMNLGERLVTLNFPSSTSFSFIELSSATDTQFTSWNQVLGTFDSFNFNRGTISGVDAAYFEGFSGEANYFFRVPEPAPIALISLAYIFLLLKRQTRCRRKAIFNGRVFKFSTLSVFNN